MVRRARAARRLLALAAAALIVWPAGLASAQAWRDTYIKGLEHADAKRWTEAVQAFDAAIQGNPKENKSARLYGMRYGYFPHRDKGIALYQLGRYDEAITALQESIRQGATAEATRTLDLARKRQPAVALPQVFRGTWWDHYERGLKYSEAGAWKPAIADFRAARSQRDKEDRSARTYGVAFIEYFPVRELGIALYHEGQFKAAVEALERSLAGFPTAKAAYYYNLARGALLRQAAADPRPPRIKIDAPADGLLTNALATEVRGTAESKNQVAVVDVNGEPQIIDAAVASQPFIQVARLAPGPNVIQVRAQDLLGQETRATVTVLVDREGPVVVIDRAARAGGVIRLEGTVFDNVRLGALAINGRAAALGSGTESTFATDVPVTATAFAIEAADAVGNVTRVRIPIPADLRQSGRRPRPEIVPVAWPAPRRQLPSFLRGGPALAVEMEALPAEVQQETISVSWIVTASTPLASVKINEETKTLRQTEAGKPQIFSHILALVDGPNQVTVTATDRAGNTVTKTARVVRKVEEVEQIGARLAVAVMPFTHKGQPSPVYGGAFDAMVNELVNQGRFKVVSRDQLENILRELKLSSTSLVDQATAVRAGKLAAAEAIVVVTVNESAKSVEAYVQLINTETTTVLASKDVFDPEKAPGTARAKMRELAAKLKQEYPLVGGSVVQVSNQRVAVGMGSAKKVRADMKVIVYQEGEPLVDPQTKAVLDRNIEPLGEGLLKDVRPQVSFAVMEGKDLGKVERMIAQKKLLKVITK
jgi:curli biogenesis system outer membrane secretion channel CsgG